MYGHGPGHGPAESHGPDHADNAAAKSESRAWPEREKTKKADTEGKGHDYSPGRASSSMHMDVCSNTWQGWDSWHDREAIRSSTDAAKWTQQEVDWKKSATGWQTTDSEAREWHNSDNTNIKRLKAWREENWDRNTSDHSPTVVRTPPDIKGDDVKFDRFCKGTGEATGAL